MLLIRRVRGASMQPALKPGRLVIGYAWRKKLRPGSVVIFSHDGFEKIKRIRRIDGAYYYLLGDNECASTDSRQFGWVSRNRITALVIWPRLKLK